MEAFSVRFWNHVENKESIILTTIEDMIKYPTGLNMLDVGIILFNEHRKQLGLNEVDPATVAGSLQDLRKTGRL